MLAYLFLKVYSRFYFSPVDSLNRLIGSSSSSILSEIAGLIFASGGDNYSHSKSASCGHLLSPLLRDVLDMGGYLGSEKYLLSPEMHQSLLGFAYMNLVNTPNFASLRESLIISALIETLFRYNLGSKINLMVNVCTYCSLMKLDLILFHIRFSKAYKPIFGSQS